MDHFPVCYRFKNVAARDFIHDKSDHIDDGVCDNVNVDTFIMGLENTIRHEVLLYT